MPDLFQCTPETPCGNCQEQRALGPDAPQVSFQCWARERTQPYINEVQRLHDDHVARCPLCKVADYCVVAEARRKVLDAWNE